MEKKKLNALTVYLNSSKMYAIKIMKSSSKYFLYLGPMNIRNQLLPEMIREGSVKFNARDRSFCHADGYSNRIRCKSRKGCFDFHNVHGIRMVNTF